MFEIRRTLPALRKQMQWEFLVWEHIHSQLDGCPQPVKKWLPIAQIGHDVKPDDSCTRRHLINKLWRNLPHRPPVNIIIFLLHTHWLCSQEFGLPACKCMLAQTINRERDWFASVLSFLLRQEKPHLKCCAVGSKQWQITHICWKGLPLLSFSKERSPFPPSPSPLFVFLIVCVLS